MYYVYQLRSKILPDYKYTGYATDINSRVEFHNKGKVSHTSKYKPWELVNHFAFTDKDKAKAFEKYLKSGSGRVFAQRHFW